jgi:predicted transcriptional regulator/putative methionine-R-sulfoxide reductase with GAF domain
VGLMAEIDEHIEEQIQFIRKKLPHIKTIEGIAKIINKAIYLIIPTDKIAFAIIEDNILKSVKVIGKRLILDLNLDEPSINCRAIKTKKPQLVFDTREDQEYYPGAGPNLKEMRSELCVPIIHKDQVLGTINLESRQPSYFTQRNTEIIKKFVEEIESSVYKLLKENIETESLSNTNRSTKELYRDFLRVINDGETKKTRICNAAGVPWHKGTDILQQLESKGHIILEQKNPYRKNYTITEQGLEALHAYDELETKL